MLDLSKLYQTTITDQDGVERTHPCRIVSFNTVTEKYGISVAGIGNVLFVNAGDLETTDQSTPSGSITINDDGSYDVSAYAGVTVNVNNLGSTTVTDDGTVNSTHYSSVVVNVNNEQNPKQITTYANDIDTTHFASVDTTALEPTGSYTITENGTYNIKDKASVTVNVTDPTAQIWHITFDSDGNEGDTIGVYDLEFWTTQEQCVFLSGATLPAQQSTTGPTSIPIPEIVDEYLEIYTFAGYVDSEEKIFDHTSDDIIFGSDGTTPYTPQQNNERLYAAYDPV